MPPSWQIEYDDLGGRSQVQIWDVRGSQFVREDWRPGERFRGTLMLSATKTNTLESMLFNVGLFTPFAQDCASFFNERLDPKGEKDWNRPTTAGEVLQSWGYYITLALNPSVPVEQAWRKKRQPGDLFPPLDMGRHGMSKNRLKKMRELQAQMFSVDEDELDANDPWRYCRAPIAAFNLRRRSLVIPSWLLTLDESMCPYTGTEGVEPGKGADFKPIPLLSFVERKPEPLGCELKVAADGNSGVFLNLEIQEGAEAHAQQQWFDEYGHTAACSLRLLEPWFKGPRRPGQPWFKGPEQPTRACYGDSWFSGVNNAEAIFVESGKVIYPFGDVKTNTSRGAWEELKAECGPNSGDWATFTTEVHLEDDTILDMMAVAHRRGPTVHTYLSTHGLTTRGNPQRHKDDDLDADTGFVITRKCPAVLNDATLAQPKIDRGNRRRQHDLAIEKRFRTEAFPFRLFTTVLGMCISDSYYLDQYHNKPQKLEFRPACERMAWAMMYNNVDQIANGDCSSADLYRKPDTLTDEGESPFTATPSKSPYEESCGHVAVPLHCIPGYIGGKQQNCVVCGKKCSYACVLCSTKDLIMPLHQPYLGVGKPTGYKCAVEHRRSPYKHEAIRPNGRSTVAKERRKKRAEVARRIEEGEGEEEEDEVGGEDDEGGDEDEEGGGEDEEGGGEDDEGGGEDDEDVGEDDEDGNEDDEEGGDDEEEDQEEEEEDSGEEEEEELPWEIEEEPLPRRRSRRAAPAPAPAEPAPRRRRH